MVFAKIDKKIRFLISSVMVGVLLYFVSIVFFNASLYLRLAIGTLTVLVLVLFSHYPNINLRTLTPSFVLPLTIIIGALLSLKYYPNLSIYFKLFAILVFSGLYYVASLVDNIFLVVDDREEVIPLYRVGVTWSQILLVTIAIPLFAGIFKVPVNAILSTAAVCFFAFVFNMYQLWALRYENRISPVGVGRSLIFSAIVAFFVGCIALPITFVPAESFLRGLTVASALMLGLSYIWSHLKNDINLKAFVQYILILLIFLILTYLFD